MNTYTSNTELVAKNNYLDLFKQGEKYLIHSSENCLGDEMYYLKIKKK